MRLLFCLLIAIGFASSSYGQGKLSPNLRWVESELQKLGVRKSFIKEALNNYQTDTYETVLKLNLLGFMKPPGQHMDRVTPQSIEETLKYLKANEPHFKAAKKKHKVPPEVISALLWIETRHGDDRGQFHIVSVYMHLLQAERLKPRKYLTDLALEQNEKHKQYKRKELKALMKERVKRKSNWAREQLLALSEIHKKKKLDLKELKGSFAGAFGIAQFIPSSYRDYAQAAKPKASPNLYDAADAIMSVANYLKKHGWNNKKSKSKISALMKYNNSRDYADSILEISKRAIPTEDSKQNRDLSSAR